MSSQASCQFNSGNNEEQYTLHTHIFRFYSFMNIQAGFHVLGCYLTWRCHNGSHWESITNALRHCNHIRNDVMTLESPEVASCSPKSSLDLSGCNKDDVFILLQYCLNP